MMASARASYGTRRWTAMSSGKSSGHARSDIETIGSGSAATSPSSAADAARDDRRPHLLDQRSRGGDVEPLALVVDRRRRHAGLDQLDPPPVHDLVVGRRRDGDGPAEMIGDAQTHAAGHAVADAAASARAASRAAVAGGSGGSP